MELLIFASDTESLLTPPTRSISEMLRQTSPKAASGSTGFAMLPSAHRTPQRRDSKAFKMETQFNTGRAWFLSVALLLGTLGFVLVDHSSRTANLRGHLHEKHARAHGGGGGLGGVCIRFSYCSGDA